jgi:hypothetical protein
MKAPKPNIWMSPDMALVSETMQYIYDNEWNQMFYNWSNAWDQKLY